MLQYIFLPIISFLSVICVTYSEYEHKHNEGYLGTHFPSSAAGDAGMVYNEYPEYGNKVHHTSRELGWSNPLQRKKNPGSHSRNMDGSGLELIPDWPDPSKQLGQLSAVSIDQNGNVVVFHRGNRTWGAQTFRYDNVYNERNMGPLVQNTIVVFNATSGKAIDEWGSNMFYLPHGLTVDFENNIWVTDVALHQVFKFTPNSNSRSHPSLSLGTPFIPGNDDNHFCKPTDVAVLSSGDFFVSDGYCNSRIIKFNGNGHKIMVWGRGTFQVGHPGTRPPPNHFLVPHALAIAEEIETLFVADRENGRIQCFNASSGNYIMQLQSHIMGTRLFSVAYSPAQGGVLYVVNGPGVGVDQVQVGGFVISLASKHLLQQFNTKDPGFQNPHDVAVSLDGNSVYVVELNPFKMWKFVRGGLNQSSPMKGVTENVHVAVSANVSGGMQVVPLKSDVLQLGQSSTAYKNNGSIAMAVAVILGIIAVIVVMVAIAIIRIRRGVSKSYRELAVDYD